MASGQAGKAQVRAFRFATRQVEWALTQGRGLVLVDPGQRARRWSVVSFFLALLILAGFTVYGFLKPAPDWRAASLILDTDAGALYVNRSGVLYPALNLTSALLAMDAAEGADTGRAKPTEMGSADISAAPRGATMGIPGAPSQLPTVIQPPHWGACDGVVLDPTLAEPTKHPQITTTVVAGAGTPGAPMPSSEAALVRVPGPRDPISGVVDNTSQDGDVFLLREGSRSRIDLDNDVIVKTFSITPEQIRPITAGLLNTIPEVAAIAVPVVDGAGAAPEGFVVGDLLVGEIFGIERATGDQYFVILSDGLVEISRTVADLFRFSDSTDVSIPMLLPDVVTGVPLTQNPPDWSAIPPTVPEFVSVEDEPLLCTEWDGTDQLAPSLVITTATALPDSDTVVELAGNAGAGAQQVIVPPGSGVVGREWVVGQSPAVGTLYLVNDLGVAFPVESVGVLERLGLTSRPKIAPAAFLALLPKGPVLGIEAAGRLHDIPAVVDVPQDSGGRVPAENTEQPADDGS